MMFGQKNSNQKNGEEIAAEVDRLLHKGKVRDAFAKNEELRAWLIRFMPDGWNRERLLGRSHQIQAEASLDQGWLDETFRHYALAESHYRKNIENHENLVHLLHNQALTLTDLDDNARAAEVLEPGISVARTLESGDLLRIMREFKLAISGDDEYGSDTYNAVMNRERLSELLESAADPLERAAYQANLASFLLESGEDEELPEAQELLLAALHTFRASGHWTEYASAIGALRSLLRRNFDIIRPLAEEALQESARQFRNMPHRCAADIMELSHAACMPESGIMQASVPLFLRWRYQAYSFEANWPPRSSLRGYAV